MMNGCGEYGEDLSAFVDGALDAERKRDVEAHLPGCAACRTLLDAERQLDTALRALPSVEPSPQFEVNFWARLARAEEDEPTFWQRLVSSARAPIWAVGTAAGLAAAIFLIFGDPAPTEEDWAILTDSDFELLIDDDLELIVSLDVLEAWDGSEV